MESQTSTTAQLVKPKTFRYWGFAVAAPVMFIAGSALESGILSLFGFASLLVPAVNYLKQEGGQLNIEVMPSGKVTRERS